MEKKTSPNDNIILKKQGGVNSSANQKAAQTSTVFQGARTPRDKFRMAGHVVGTLTSSQKRARSMRELLKKPAEALATFVGAGGSNDVNKWKDKFNEEAPTMGLHLPHIRSKKNQRDSILQSLERTVDRLTEDTDIDNAALIEEIASEGQVEPIHFYNPHAVDVFQQLNQISACEDSDGVKASMLLLNEEKKGLRKRQFASDELVTGQEAFEQYKVLVELEKQDIAKKLKHKKELALAKLMWQERMLENVKNLATEYYRNPTGKAAEEWEKLQNEVNSSEYTNNLRIQTKLSELPTYFPFFTYLIIVIQLLSFIVVISLGKVTTVGIEPKLLRSGLIATFLGFEIIDKWQIPNIWIGPDYKFFVGIGAVYAPCMRPDYLRINEYLQTNFTRDRELGCCEIRLRNIAGTTTEDECAYFTAGGGKWKKGVLCSERLPGENSVAHEIRPCCLGSRGQCIMITHVHCVFLGGIRSMYWEHCSKVNCLSHLCSFGGFRSDKNLLWKSEDPGQWWRFILAIFYHPGIIQCALIMIGQFVIMKPLENIAGWLRVSIIYFTCSLISYAASAAFEPYMPHMGGAGALSGIIGVTFIEMMQSWPLIKRPWLELLKIIGIMVFIMLSGTLPFLNNYGHFFGFITGILCALILLPYITFGKWSAVARRILVVVALPLILMVFVLTFYAMYKVQIYGCAACDKFNCINFTTHACRYTELADDFDIYDM